MKRRFILIAMTMIGGCATTARSGDADAPKSFAGTQWAIASINGAVPSAERNTAISFDNERISGNAGCNSFGGGYAVSGGTMTVTQVISTKMACVGPGMDQENAFFKILAAPMTMAWGKDGALTLSDGAGSVTLAPTA
ncbi:META domain-containing protein [Sphingomonas koreensis]|nr:META domain-containing protein [Sphingomonas koreensis]